MSNMVMGDVDDIRMSSVQEFDDDLGQSLKIRSAEKSIPELPEKMGDTGQNFNNAAKSARKVPVVAQIEEEDDIELRNFASAPVNAKSALRGNEPLRERHEALLEEL